MEIRHRPWCFRFWLAPYQWLTFSPATYAPEAYWAAPASAAWPPIVAHEAVHIRQQEAMGRWRWLWRYLTDKDFKLDQEAQGIAAEVNAHPYSERMAVIARYATQLAGSDYSQCASSPEAAAAKIRSYL